MIKNEFFWGIVVGVVLTIFGTLVQFKLFAYYDKQKINNELAIITCKTINSRLIRSSNVITSSSSDVFNERWNEYIIEGVYKWNEYRGLIEHYLAGTKPLLKSEFNSLNSKFGVLHNNLIRIRQLQNSISKDKQIELVVKKKKSLDICKDIQETLNKFENELLQFN